MVENMYQCIIDVFSFLPLKGFGVLLCFALLCFALVGLCFACVVRIRLERSCTSRTVFRFFGSQFSSNNRKKDKGRDREIPVGTQRERERDINISRRVCAMMILLYLLFFSFLDPFWVNRIDTQWNSNTLWTKTIRMKHSFFVFFCFFCFFVFQFKKRGRLYLLMWKLMCVYECICMCIMYICILWV